MTDIDFEGSDLRQPDPFADLGTGLRKVAVWWEANKQKVYEAFAWAATSYVMAESLPRSRWDRPSQVLSRFRARNVRIGDDGQGPHLAQR